MHIMNWSQGSIFRHHAIEISDMSEIQLLFRNCFSSQDIAEKIMFKYGLTTEASRTELTTGIIGFLTDTGFSYPIACARKSFTNRIRSRRHHIVISEEESLS